VNNVEEDEQQLLEIPNSLLASRYNNGNSDGPQNQDIKENEN